MIDVLPGVLIELDIAEEIFDQPVRYEFVFDLQCVLAGVGEVHSSRHVVDDVEVLCNWEAVVE